MREMDCNDVSQSLEQSAKYDIFIVGNLSCWKTGTERVADEVPNTLSSSAASAYYEQSVIVIVLDIHLSRETEIEYK